MNVPEHPNNPGRLKMEEFPSQYSDVFIHFSPAHFHTSSAQKEADRLQA